MIPCFCFHFIPYYEELWRALLLHKGVARCHLKHSSSHSFLVGYSGWSSKFAGSWVSDYAQVDNCYLSKWHWQWTPVDAKIRINKKCALNFVERYYIFLRVLEDFHIQISKQCIHMIKLMTFSHVNGQANKSSYILFAYCVAKLFFFSCLIYVCMCK